MYIYVYIYILSLHVALPSRCRHTCLGHVYTRQALTARRGTCISIHRPRPLKAGSLYTDVIATLITRYTVYIVSVHCIPYHDYNIKLYYI